MKKLTLSVAALTIATMSYGQCVLSATDSLKLEKFELNEIINTSEDMIEWIGYDVENGKIYEEYAKMYIENLEEIITTTRNLIANKE